MLGWVRDKQPNSPVYEEFVNDTLDSVFKGQCSNLELADYIVLYLGK
jgi:hypothetical protein